MNLKEKLIKDNKIRWLDIGCGEIFEAGFLYWILEEFFVFFVFKTFIFERPSSRNLRVNFTTGQVK